jgi:hypothetical protein
MGMDEDTEGENMGGKPGGFPSGKIVRSNELSGIEAR